MGIEPLSRPKNDIAMPVVRYHSDVVWDIYMKKSYLLQAIRMPITYHLAHATHPDFRFDILPVSIHGIRRNVQFRRNLIRLAISGDKPEHIHLAVSQLRVKFRTAYHSLMLTLATQWTLDFFKDELPILVDVKIILVVFTEVAADESVNHAELVMPSVHRTGRVELHQPGMRLRMTVPDDGKHILDGGAVGLTEHDRRTMQLFHHHVTFGGGVELDVSYLIHPLEIVLLHSCRGIRQ